MACTFLGSPLCPSEVRFPPKNLQSWDLKTNYPTLKLFLLAYSIFRSVMTVVLCEDSALPWLRISSVILWILGTLQVLFQDFLEWHLTLLDQVVVLAIWTRDYWRLSSSCSPYVVKHANILTLYPEGWSTWSWLALVGCHQLSCCTIGFTVWLCWNPCDLGTISGNLLASSQGLLLIHFMYSLTSVMRLSFLSLSGSALYAGFRFTTVLGGGFWTVF